MPEARRTRYLTPSMTCSSQPSLSLSHRNKMKPGAVRSPAPVCAAAVILDPETPDRGPKRLETAHRKSAATPSPPDHGACDRLGGRLGQRRGDRRVQHTPGQLPRHETRLRRPRRLAPPTPCRRQGSRRLSPARSPRIIGGDALEPCISAASILAKTARDAHMVKLCAQYPGYGFSKHKGYGSAAHGQER